MAQRLQSFVRNLKRLSANTVLNLKLCATDMHLLYRWAWNAVTDARIIDPVTSLLGPNVLLWSMNWFIKEPGDGGYVSLHQDASYWGLESRVDGLGCFVKCRTHNRTDALSSR